MSLDLENHNHTVDSPMRGWTNDPTKALSFPKKEIAEIIINREKELLNFQKEQIKNYQTVLSLNICSWTWINITFSSLFLELFLQVVSF